MIVRTALRDAATAPTPIGALELHIAGAGIDEKHAAIAALEKRAASSGATRMLLRKADGAFVRAVVQAHAEVQGAVTPISHAYLGMSEQEI